MPSDAIDMRRSYMGRWIAVRLWGFAMVDLSSISVVIWLRSGRWRRSFCVNAAGLFSRLKCQVKSWARS
jgi:hypothetical protein